MSTIAVTDAGFEGEVLKAEKPVLVDFWAEWCGPCKQIGPVLEDVSGEMADKVTIAKVNIDENPEAPTRYGVRSIPTMLLFKGGEVAAMKIGATSKTDLTAWLNENL
ncbi:thioredoxin [Emcibacter sp.]|uniref:thioredoxin n=1 Tax=Emcibacter sp. TaxID=1979954 RepID=UPI002AA68A91|nr:thioredoxin [Emcibacter sp.]